MEAALNAWQAAARNAEHLDSVDGLVLARQPIAARTALTEIGLRSWTATCQGHGRTYRLRSENPTDWRSSDSVASRNLRLLDPSGETLYYTERFHPDRYEAEGIWSFDTG